MGQRSQIYVRYNNGNKKGLIANYYGWNYGERMISRAKWGIYHILENLKYDWYYTDKTHVTKLSRIFDTNFDMQNIAISCDIIAERAREFPEENFNDYVFLMQDNNNGKLLIDICNDGIKYAFLDREANPDNIMDGEAYMCWDDEEKWRDNQYLSEEAVKTCEDNIRYISENATLMTKEEVVEFISYDYELDNSQNERSYEELQQAVAEYEQRENIFATQKWTLGDIEDILISDENVQSYTDEDIKKISVLAKEELENCSDNTEFIQTVVARYFNEKADSKSIIEKEKMRQIDITKEDIRCTDELIVNTDYINATYELWFDVDQYFGTSTKEDDSTWINFYTCWYPDGKMKAVCIVASDNKDTEILWELTEEEIEFFRNKMEAYCQEQNNRSLQELWDDFYNENN